MINRITSGVAWNDRYSLGNEQIDIQHKKLFALVSDLVNACMDGSNTEKLQEALMFLGNYTVQHFYFEEELQLQHNYPDYDTHKRLHEEFKKEIDRLVTRFKKNDSSIELSNDLNKIVVRWLVNHIPQEDKKIGEYIRNISNK